VAFDVFLAAAIFLALISALAAAGRTGEEGPVAEDMLRALILELAAEARAGGSIRQGCRGQLDQRTKPLYTGASSYARYSGT
jgi:hypothetical protein